MLPRPRPVDPGQVRREQAAHDVEEIVRNQPEHIAVQVGQWLKE